MRGDIIGFKKKISKTMQESLKNYKSDIEIVLNSAKIFEKSKNVQENDINKNFEQEL